ncbi:MAG TPA: VRR-NUC domain-containing protein [Phycisphaerae bacterium]|nr:VRR-NUC domain-containing protein [Phycisphaerae bacterium]
MSLRESDVFRPRRRRRKPERNVQRACLAWLRARGALVAVTDAGAAYRAGAFFGDAIPAGWPDITGLLPNGRFIGIECKSPKGRQSAAQKAMEREVRNRNGIYILARCVEDVERGIEDACVEG